MATILIAEDDSRILRVCKMWLTREGHSVLEASDGQKAMEVLDSQEVDVLVSDVDMPALSGSELVAWWRDKKKSSKPVIMFTASCSQEDLSSRMQHYDVCFLPKPFSPPRLISTINRLLGNQLASAPRPPCGMADVL